MVFREFQDFAGSGVVHLGGGVFALVGAIMLGPRIGRFRPEVKGIDSPGIVGHSIPLVSLGAFILVFGFFAFNGGSQAKISEPEDGATVALAIVNTLLGCIGGGLSVLFIIKIFKGGNWSLVQLVNGCLAGEHLSPACAPPGSTLCTAGMVSVCAGCDVMKPWAGLATGVIGGCLYVCFSKTMAYAR